MIDLHKVWVVIPGYNEARHIGKVIGNVKKEGFENILFIDDGSRDRSASAARKAGAEVLRNIVNMGKGAALKTGCDKAVQEGADFLVVMDADGQHDPEEIKLLLKALDKKDIVFGYRTYNRNMPPVYRLGNGAINLLSSSFTGIRLKDTQSGFRAFTKTAYRKIRWKALDYSMESEMIVRAGKSGLRYAQVPIRTKYADKYKGTTIIDGLKIALNMLWWRLTR